RIESIYNNNYKGFISIVGKVNSIDIILVFKPGGKFNSEYFFNRKKRYILNLYTIYNINKEIIYLLAS
ncbi:hypothetical protein BDR22DRAFT_808143, partial [Usnea florida]